MLWEPRGGQRIRYRNPEAGSLLRKEIARLNEILVPLVKQGQSIHQIYLTHKDELMCSEKTLYNYVDGCLFDIRNIDLPRKVKYRPRYKNRS